MSGLFEAKQPDGFQHESPIRAFTTFDVDGAYAIGKGFRPSIKHLPTYLNAMQTKEGWILVQILFGDSDPTMVFRKFFSGGPVSPDRKVFMSPALGTPYSGGPALEPGSDPYKVFAGHNPKCAFTMAGEPCNCNPEVTSERAAQEDADDIKAGKHDAAQSFHKFETVAAATVTSERQKDGSHVIVGWEPGRDNPPYETLDHTAFSGEKLPPVELSVSAGINEIAPEHIEALFDDPINPKHYKGTGCAEIAENMPGSLAHAITYLWRAGDKPDQPEVQEIGKAVWWLKRELAMAESFEAAEDGEDEMENLLPGQEAWLIWRTSSPHRPKGKRSVEDRPFFKFAMKRVEEAKLPYWRSETIRAMIIYCTEKKAGALKGAISKCEQRIACLNDATKCGEYGRQLEA